MIFIRIFILGILILSGSCSKAKKTSDTIELRILRGPSAIVFAWLMDEQVKINGRTISIKIADSPEIIQAQLIKGEADIAVLPTVSAANLYNKGVTYKLLGCPVWGTIYLVGRNNSRDLTTLKGSTIYMFGQGTIPDIVTRYYLIQHGFSEKDITFNYTFSTPGEITQALLTRKAATATLSEPFLSVALKKDSTLHILANLNNPKGNDTGFAQTAIVISPETEEYRTELDSLIQQSCSFALNNPGEAIRIMEKNNIFPPGMLTGESIQRCMIHYIPAVKVKDELFNFLDIIYKYEPKAIGNKLPDMSFINL